MRPNQWPDNNWLGGSPASKLRGAPPIVSPLMDLAITLGYINLHSHLGVPQPFFTNCLANFHWIRIKTCCSDFSGILLPAAFEITSKRGC